jgi:hypothetical protein
MALTTEFGENILAEWLLFVFGSFLVGIPAGNRLS